MVLEAAILKIPEPALLLIWASHLILGKYHRNQVVLGIPSRNLTTLTASKSHTMQILISHSRIIALLCSSWLSYNSLSQTISLDLETKC